MLINVIEGAKALYIAVITFSIFLAVIECSIAQRKARKDKRNEKAY